jgi:DNA repair protein RadA/Sms
VETLDAGPVAVGSKRSVGKRVLPEVVKLSQVEKAQFDRIKTGISEFDTVLGGGIVLGSIILISGDPGIGKSTLLSQVALRVPKTLYVAGEESAQQIKIRVERLDSKADLAVLNEIDVDVIAAVVNRSSHP